MSVLMEPPVDRIPIQTFVTEYDEEMVREAVNRELARGGPDTATSMQAIGYKELAAALRGEYAVDEAFRLIQQRSRNYAKRQLTWFRRNEKMHWLVRGAGGSDASIFQEALQIIPFFAG